MRQEAERWWRQAQEDMKTVRSLLSAERFAAAAFYSQQAVEKALKAFVVESCHMTAPWLHDLLALAEVVRDYSGTPLPPEILSLLRELNHHYTVPRYPDAANGVPEEQYDERISSRAYNQAQEVIRWIKQRI